MTDRPTDRPTDIATYRPPGGGKKLHVVTATKELHDEENVAKQVASQGRMEFKLNDEAFNKLQKKVIEELVAKLKLLERKISLLSKENSLPTTNVK